MDDTRSLRAPGATPRTYGATPRESGENEDEGFGRRRGENFVLRRTVLLFGVAMIAALAAITFQGTYANVITAAKFGVAADVETDPTPEETAVSEQNIEQVIPSTVKLSEDVPTAACACDADVTETIAMVLDSVPHDCAPLSSMDKTCLATAACDALKASVNVACPGSIS